MEQGKWERSFFAALSMTGEVSAFPKNLLVKDTHRHRPYEMRANP